MTITTLTVRADRQPLWLCFEPWANEYTVPADTTVVIHFDDKLPIEVTHHPDGMTFFSGGKHPDIYAEDGSPLEILSDVMPEPPGVALDALRAVIAATPPRRL
ncbi:hypothetical protein [Kibdelosporangium phytohabitans]|uniref:Uncharacterized protein n=1 Tax=Kibdelosporangium phytohabitans TaxID=860235 RepID=A0A0N9I7F9_9PSEU|nr:hypothetical protein [Kibdelosporangium phytohabitans]ALG14147.1 hypothetical protein AOZ06_51275 [Kibdelosporangium phytohabitans]MBE1466867.1 hypothetical protein [Kibdelosporangium phytohabitans]